MGDLMPVFEVADHPAGLFIGVRRDAEPGTYYWRITPWCMPAFTMIAPRGPSGARPFLDPDRRRKLLGLEFRLPSDTSADRGRGRRDARRQGHPHPHHSGHVYSAGQPGQRLPDGSGGAEGRADLQRRAGIAMQDASLQESMGPIIDRSKEHLTTTDNGIIMARQRLMRAARALAEKAWRRPATDPATHRVRSAAVVLPVDQVFHDAAAREALTAGRRAAGVGFRRRRSGGLRATGPGWQGLVVKAVEAALNGGTVPKPRPKRAGAGDRWDPINDEGITARR
jgi:phthalate 4,5-dioxygenase oxygenase subunit